MALVVVGHRPGFARPRRQTRLRAIERLNLRFFVDRQEDRVLGQVHVEADDVLERRGELGLGRALEGPNAVRRL